MQRFDSSEVPVASSMIRAVRRLPSDITDPLFPFMCYWIAFNNVYVTIADQNFRNGAGRQRVKLSLNPDGTNKTEEKGGVYVPKVATMLEKDQIAGALEEFSSELKHDLIVHASTRFFVQRTPKWQGQVIQKDAQGQILNGVLNVGKTIDEAHPNWSPIDTTEYEDYIKNSANGSQADAALQEKLAEQILDVLYTVRNNTFHGGKSADDASDRTVLQHALPLLSMIVHGFIGGVAV